MDRAEAKGFGIALAGHVALIAALSLGFAAAMRPPTLNQPMEVSFVEDVGLQNATPEPAIEPPAQSVAPDLGPPEEPAPAPAATPAPPSPAPKPVEAPPEPKPVPKPAAKPAPARPAPAKSEPKKETSASSAKAEKPRGSRLGKDFLKGIGSDPSPSKSQKQTGVMSATAMASIASAIVRQVQPCANRQVKPGPGAERIRVTINLRLNRDGSLAARPRVTDYTGVDDENRRYLERVQDLAIATFVGCAPLRGLPQDLYDVDNGWSNFSLRYSLPG